MSQVMKERCHAITKRRGQNTRCKHATLRGIYCWQHEKALHQMRIKTSEIPGAKMGLFTTKFIKKGAVVAEYTGDIVVDNDINYSNPYALQIKERPATFIDASKTNEPGEGRWVNDGLDTLPNNAELVHDKKKKRGMVRALRDIQPDEEILADYGDDYPWHKEVAEVELRAARAEPAKPRVLHKPDHGPDHDEPVSVAWAKDKEAQKKAAKPKVAGKQARADAKHEKDIRDRFRVVQDLFQDKQLAQDLKVPVSKKIVKIPERKGADIVQWQLQLEKALQKAMQDLAAHFNKNPRNDMTYSKVNQIVDQVREAEKKAK